MAEVPSIESQNRNTPPEEKEVENINEHQPESSNKLDGKPPTTEFKEVPRQWPKLLSDFFKKMNLIQTKKIFDTELLVVPTELYNSFEAPISELLKGFQELVSLSASESTIPNHEASEENPSKRSKSFSPESLAFSKTRKELDQDVNDFISQKKAKIILSNKKEFVRKTSTQEMSCARVNTKKINPSLHIKTSVAHNREGPLIRSLGSSRNDAKNVHQLAGTWSHQAVNSHATEQMDIVERLENIEEHLNLVYTETELKLWKPIDRIRAVEAKIMQLERLLPSWASQHFNQPNRKLPASSTPNYPVKDSRGRIFLSSEPRPND